MQTTPLQTEFHFADLYSLTRSSTDSALLGAIVLLLILGLLRRRNGEFWRR